MYARTDGMSVSSVSLTVKWATRLPVATYRAGLHVPLPASRNFCPAIGTNSQS